jgi:nicotinamide mononucleotide transporter
MSPLEIAAVVTGFLSVFFTIYRSNWLWPTGLVSVALYAVVFYEARLYSDVVLQAIFIPLQVYGWWHWVHGAQDAPELPIRRLGVNEALGFAALAGGLIALDGYLMHRYADAALPYWDAAIAVLSLLAQYLIARKVLENWLIWIAVDMLALGVYWAKDLRLTTALYAVFLVMAGLGLVAWTRAYRKQPRPACSSGSSCPRTSGTVTTPTLPEGSSGATIA